MHPNALRNLLPKSGPRYGKGILWHIAILVIEIFRRRFKRCNSVIGQGTRWLWHNSASCDCHDSRVILRLTFEKWLKPLEICFLVYFLRFHLKAWKKPFTVVFLLYWEFQNCVSFSIELVCCLCFYLNVTSVCLKERLYSFLYHL